MHGTLSTWEILYTAANEPVGLKKIHQRTSDTEILPLWLTADTGGGHPADAQLFCGVNDLDVRHTKTPSYLGIAGKDGHITVVHAFADLSPVTCIKSVSSAKGGEVLICAIQMNRTCTILTWSAAASARVVTSTRLAGSGGIFSFALSAPVTTAPSPGLQIYICEDSGEVSQWRLILAENGAPAGVSASKRIRFSESGCSAYSVDLLTPSLMLICSAAGFHLAEYGGHNDQQHPQTASLQWHDVACCGATPCGPTGVEYYAVGDLSGRVLLWSASSSHEGTPQLTLYHEAAVRCIAAIAVEPEQGAFVLLCGLMDGSVHIWKLTAVKAVLQEVGHAVMLPTLNERVITSIASHPTRPAVAVADSLGNVTIFEGREMQYAATSATFSNHQRPHVSSKEVWSVAWNADGSVLALANEDYTAKTLRYDPVASTLSLEHTMTGPAAATTSVRWRGDMLFASSDDCTIHAWTIPAPGQGSPALHSVFKTDASHLVRPPHSSGAH